MVRISRAFVVLATLTACACSGGRAGNPTAPTPPSLPLLWNVERDGVPKFITHDYIDTTGVRDISRFRSGEGHSYADHFESCRSMKHYFRVPTGPAAATIPIYAPVSGMVVRTITEWAGVQIHIQPDSHPAFRVIVFHVNPTTTITEGARFAAGEPIGTHIGEQTMSDVAVSANEQGGYRLVSWFDAITDALFERYRARGLSTRSEAIIGRGERDADPLTCNGETFSGKGLLVNWVRLQ